MANAATAQSLSGPTFTAHEILLSGLIPTSMFVSTNVRMRAVARLVAMFGPCRGVARDLDSPLIVGRAAEGGLQLLDEKVSREHCIIEPAGPTGHVLRDLGSRNGTWLNGQLLREATRLRPGDHLSLGESVLVYEPSFDALRARDGESTLVLTRGPSAPSWNNLSPSPDVLARAGELAVRAALAPSSEAAAHLVLESLHSALHPSSLAVLRQGLQGSLRALVARPLGAHLTLSRELVASALRLGRVLTMSEVQALPEPDKQMTRVRKGEAHVLCAPFYAGGAPAGALCVLRESPFHDEELALAGALAGAAGPSLCPSFEPRSRPPAPYMPPVAESAPMREALRLAHAAAPSPAAVLITGERGTGKEELARAIHCLGPRAPGPFVALSCGALLPELAEVELFGREKGVLPGQESPHPGVFEQADGGTLFLGEVGQLPAPLQVKLLRTLQDRMVYRVGGRAGLPVDVRVVAATHRPLIEAVRAGTFREDLYWRLNGMRIHLPPLRDRPEDVLPLAERFLARLRPRLGRHIQGFTDEARATLRAHPWPGNALQLANAIERALLLMPSGERIGPGDLPAEVGAPKPSP
ncbi:Two Component Transcriptional Regulator, Fis family [Stigmatella aurantiaca DW4/3-1]|uniref:Two Component Transcriptional Regulator, Fis family n=1 Tax=Stigmatella aurantiaca (strain DW4/3-1) TaxID=378806 RepID=Q08RY8_STIAD|nr:Two Component Transcriptional Regulator, Fis family [Stigmatella aurantiaca DW4/3-1]